MAVYRKLNVYLAVANSSSVLCVYQITGFDASPSAKTNNVIRMIEGHLRRIKNSKVYGGAQKYVFIEVLSYTL